MEEDLQTASDLLIPPGQGHGNRSQPTQSLEAKLQANSEEIKSLSSCLANMQAMIATLLDKQERQPDTALTDSQDAAQEYFPEDFFGQQGACYDPQQGF